MRKIYIPVYCILSLLLCSSAARSQGNSWYKCYVGTIGQRPAVIHLHKMNTQYAGYYYYQSTQQPVYFLGNDTATGNGSIRVFPYIAGVDIPTLIMTISGKTLKGNWQKNEAAKPLAVVATEKATLPISYDMFYLSGSVQLRPSMKESPEGTYEAGTIWPRQKSSVATGIRSVISGSFGDSLEIRDMKNALQQLKTQYIRTYVDDYKEVADSEMVEYPFSYNMEESRWMIIAYQSPKLLTLAEWYYTYAGGAHGSSNTTYYNIDLTTGKQLKLENILQQQGVDKLNGLLAKYFRMDRGLKKDEDLTEGGLFENKLEYNANFYVTGKGICFSYAPYEIASYADGQVEIFIPFTELTKYLQPGFRKLL